MNELLIITGLAFADSINPSTLAIGLYLLLHRKYARKVLFFMSGIFSSYYAFGLVLGLGFDRFLHQLWQQRHPLLTVLYIIIGVTIIIYGLLLKRRPQASMRLQSTSVISAHSAFGLGTLATLLDLPTAFPYLGALSLIGSLSRNFGEAALLLLAYNVIVILPLMLLLVLRMALHKRSRATMKHVSDTILAWEQPVLSVSLIIIGTLFVLNALRMQ